MSSLPPQRRAGPVAGPGQGPGRGAPKLSPREGAEQAEARLGLPCFHAGQKVQGVFSCVADQFQINNRGILTPCRLNFAAVGFTVWLRRSTLI